MNKTQRKNVKKWIDALRSGEYKQGTGQLRSTDDDGNVVAYCCLGVLDTLNGEVCRNTQAALMRWHFEKITGIPDTGKYEGDTWQDHLGDLNDGLDGLGTSASFAKIAVSIERRAEKVHPGWREGL